MQLIKELFSVNEILTVSIVSWFVAQVLKTIINFILLGKFQLERMWGDGGMPSAHSATVCAMAARRAFLFAPTEESSAVTQVPMFWPMMMGMALP